MTDTMRYELLDLRDIIEGRVSTLEFSEISTLLRDNRAQFKLMFGPAQFSYNAGEFTYEVWARMFSGVPFILSTAKGKGTVYNSVGKVPADLADLFLEEMMNHKDGSDAVGTACSLADALAYRPTRIKPDPNSVKRSRFRALITKKPVEPCQCEVRPNSIDSRPKPGKQKLERRRRYECPECGIRWNSVEVPQFEEIKARRVIEEDVLGLLSVKLSQSLKDSLPLAFDVDEGGPS